ncbi:restriction endonuclease [Variovorax paradoxus]|uniref:Restriction endonuclease n=1 Tax=Variovorax paradoxus TaxID=34073 RepID=A0AA91DH70_VARPD|nr:restriction endonuclease [Variovorax paradoxus]
MDGDDTAKAGKTEPTDLTRLIQDVLSELGASADAAAVAAGVRRLDIGLPTEDEFSVICAWLGKCQLLHKLDQLQVPVDSKQKFQVPDLLARFSTQINESPVLIEVKSKKDKRLTFKEDYLARLQSYADLVRMPLLVAWKYEGIWALFEVKHMKKSGASFRISFETAMKESLLSALVGDVAYKIGAGAGIHLRFRKDKQLGAKETEDGYSEEWLMHLDDVAFTDRDGNRRDDLDDEVQSLFTAWNLEQNEEHTGSHVQVRFVAGDEGIEFAHKALVQLLDWEEPHDGRPHWRKLLRKEKVTANVRNFSAALKTGLRQRVVAQVFEFEPHDMPAFLRRR